MSDTTVQGNNVTFPTDAKLAKKMIDKYNKIAEREGVRQRQSYRRTAKQLVRDTYNGKHSKRAKKAGKAQRKLRTIAGGLVRELERKLSGTALAGYREEPGPFKKVLAQQRATGTRAIPCTGPIRVASPRARRAGSTSSATRSG